MIYDIWEKVVSHVWAYHIAYIMLYTSLIATLLILASIYK